MVRKKNTSKSIRAKQILRKRSKNGGSKFEMLIKKTSCHMYANLLNLINGKTLISVSTVNIFKKNDKLSNPDACREVGKKMATYCSNENIKPSINIANHRFCGLVKSLVDSFSENLKN